MQKSVRLIPQHRKRLQPLEADGVGGSGASRAVVVDEQTYWTGRDYAFTVVNDSAYPRWYRVVVTNLKYQEEYSVFTPDGPLPEDSMLAVEAGDQARITIILGGDAQGDPKTPRQFEIYVQQYVTSDARGDYELLLNDKLQWIPRPNEDSIAIAVTPEEIRVRPWQRHAQFSVSLANRSYLPIQARIRAVPAEEGKAAGLEETDEILRDPIAAQEEQPVLCDVTIARTLKEPVSLRVEADADIPTLNLKRTTPAASVEIVPVPLLKAWQDWLVIGVGVFLLTWLLFGMLPFVHPHTQVVIQFVGTPPAGAKPTDLDVTLTPADTQGRPANLPPLKGIAAPNVSGDKFVYNFDWGWMLRGFRWTWTDYDLKLSIPPNSKYTLFAKLEDRLLDGKISRQFGVDHSRFVVDWNQAKAIRLTVRFAANNEPKPTDDVNVQVLLDNNPVLTDKYFPGKQFRLPDDRVAASTAYQVRVVANNVTTGADADSGVIALPPDTQPHELSLKFGVKTASITIPAGDPPAPFQWTVQPEQGPAQQGSSSGNGVNISVELHSPREKAAITVRTKGMQDYQNVLPLNPDTPANFGPWKGQATIADNGQNGDGKKDDKGGGKHDGSPGGKGGGQNSGNAGQGTGGKGNKGGLGGGNSTIPVISMDVQHVPTWCAALQKPELAADLTKAMQLPNALAISQLTVTPPDANNEYNVSFRVNEPCTVQIYETAPNGNVQALLMDMDSKVMPVEIPSGLYANKFSLDKGYDNLIVLACKGKISADKDVKEWISEQANGSGGLKGWAIAGTDYPHH